MLCHYAEPEYYYAESRFIYYALNAIMLSIVMLSVVMLIVVAPCQLSKLIQVNVTIKCTNALAYYEIS